MESSIERAARAMCRHVETELEAEVGGEVWRDLGHDSLDSWVDAVWPNYAGQARAALQAAKSPDEPGRIATITLARRFDGGLRVYSDELPGLILSGSRPDAVMTDVLPAIEALAWYSAFHPRRQNAPGPT